MKISRSLTTMLVLGFSASYSFADFTVSNAGPLDSAGAIGTAGNGYFTGTYSGTSTLFGTIDFSGELTRVIAGTYASEARWNITNLTAGASTTFQPTTTTSYTGTINVTKTASALVWANAGDSFGFESFESYDDGAGADSTWNNVSFNFHGGPSIFNIGNYASGTDFTIDTESSTFDTELALYTSTGTLLGNDDDGGTGTLSLLTPGVLADGDYYILAGGYNSTFANGFAFAGNATGNVNVNINGTSVYAGNHPAGTFDVLEFTVGSPVPEPASFAVLGLGAVALLRRRKK
ncbi:MAG: PEP-CTERM sorting domain-containing protein [Armatimonadetes bacterium]|nr:PEP-CTERM sorting domain-containing protein [Armatimonadota bacterium]